MPCDLLATSDEWGVTKPDTKFLDKLAAVSGHDRAEIAYVLWSSSPGDSATR